MAANIDAAFKELEKAGKTDVESIIKWMKNSKLIETATDEKKIQQLFKDSANQQQVELNEFKEIVAKLAAEQHKTFEQLAKQLAAEGPKIVDAAIEGLTAFKEALKK